MKTWQLSTIAPVLMNANFPLCSLSSEHRHNRLREPEWDPSTHLSLLDADFAEPHRVWAVVGGLHPTLGADILETKHSPVHTQDMSGSELLVIGSGWEGGNKALFSLVPHLPPMTKAS